MSWSFLKGWPKRATARRELFVHEDDWGQIEVLSAACAAWCEAEFSRIAQFSDVHRDPHADGWTDIYLRPPPPHSLAEMAIPFEDAATALAQQLSPFDEVVSGSFSSPRPVPRVRAFGTAPGSGIILVPDRTGARVDAISLILNGAADLCESVRRAASELPSRAPLLIVDWRSLSLQRL